MKFTLSWLKDHLETDEPLAALADKLTMIGLEVEHITDKVKALAAFTIATVVSAEKHPNADKLRVCMVDTGAGAPVQVVCGAPNAHAGMKAVFAAPGTHVPGSGLDLKVGTIRGVESRGMLCSARELGLSEEHDGIIEVPADAPVGAPYADFLGLSDPVVEINLTPNRPDCTAVHGIARDLAAADMGTLKDQAIRPVEGLCACPVDVTIAPGAEALCPGFALRLVSGVKNGPSPEWMQKRLTAIGLRPINALVDITNYMTFDRGRPLHVFDAKKVRGNLTIRRAQNGEKLLALDGKTYTLDAAMCVIADEQGVESLAGIMGGEATGCDATTTEVLIESALWDPVNIAQTGRKLGINSDARYRFERGVDPAFLLPGLELATRMVMDLCGGTPSTVAVAGEPIVPEPVIDFPLSELRRLTGLDLPLPEIRRVLTKLGFFMAGQDKTVKVAVPSWRPDVHGKADIVEEIVRIVGVDRIPATPFDRGPTPRKPVLTLLQQRTRKARRALAVRGLTEAVTWSFVSQAQARAFGGGAPELALSNPIAADLSDMRPSLVPGLIAAAQKNADRGFADSALFEVGQVFRGDRPEDQFISATAIRRGRATTTGTGRHWSGSAQADVFDAKADALAVLAALGAPMQALQIASGGQPDWLHPGRSGAIQMGPQNVLGHFGQLHPRTLAILGVDGPLFGFEILLDKIPEPKKKPTRAKAALELSPFQPIERDFAFIVDRSVKAADIVRVAQGSDRKLITGVSVFDLYEGKGIAADKKSVALAVTIQPREKTLTDAEIEALAQKLVADVTAKTGATLRG
ncbi:MAG TPA: phenylalanine--tRNA ligase subunit beta [Xanthobacteraceae bacterium]|jgi:phenylalanyl-tRNA synthetase beta chain|nr:phenylalanine--tRNA ligase subunit beta [Xanthobacteraceae bacterium]